MNDSSRRVSVAEFIKELPRYKEEIRRKKTTFPGILEQEMKKEPSQPTKA